MAQSKKLEPHVDREDLAADQSPVVDIRLGRLGRLERELHDAELRLAKLEGAIAQLTQDTAGEMARLSLAQDRSRTYGAAVACCAVVLAVFAVVFVMSIP